MGVVRRARMARVCLARERRACGERGEFGASRARACTERAGRRTPCAERAVMLPAVQSLRLACTERACGEGARRRTPCAERAVMLTAVQSLRLLVRRGRVERACRRTLCAGRAVILTAVQSLRLLVRRDVRKGRSR